MNSIMNHKIQMLLNESETSFNMMMDDGSEQDAAFAPKTRSALQNPELSQVRLASMLRRALRGQQSRKSQSTYWSAFMASYVNRNANSN